MRAPTVSMHVTALSQALCDRWISPPPYGPVRDPPADAADARPHDRQRPHRPGLALALAGRRRRGAGHRRLDGRPLRRVPRLRLHPRRSLALPGRRARSAPIFSSESRRLSSAASGRSPAASSSSPTSTCPPPPACTARSPTASATSATASASRPTVGYNVDSFGHTASLPDILAGHGYRAYVFRRPEEHQVSLPANVFTWQGVGGSEVTAFRIVPGYVANFADLGGQVREAVDSTDPALGHVMCFYGVGNHGGGPSKAMIDWILANPAFDGHELVFSHPDAYFDAIAPHRDKLPVVTTELQHCFPGCYSVMHDIKCAQRHGEQLLVQAETAANALAADAAERDAALRAHRRRLAGPPLHRIPRHPHRHLDPRRLGERPRHAGPRPHGRRGDPLRPHPPLVLPHAAPGRRAPGGGAQHRRSGRGTASSRPSPTSTSTTGATAGSATRPAPRLPSRRCSPARTR